LLSLIFFGTPFSFQWLMSWFILASGYISAENVSC
jgi:hypothetical protein